MGVSVGTCVGWGDGAVGCACAGESVRGVCGWLSGCGDVFVCGCWEQQPKGAFWFCLGSDSISAYLLDLWPAP